MKNKNFMNDANVCSVYGDENTANSAIVPPLYLNSLHTFDTIEELNSYAYPSNPDLPRDENYKYIYGRVLNPTTDNVQKTIAKLEHGDHALLFGSGMAAITTAILSQVQAGDHIIAIDQAYGPADNFLRNYLKKFNITTTFVNGENVDNIIQATQKNTKLIYLESPTSLFFRLQDLKAIAKYAKSKNIITIIDNSWASPLFQKPLDMGIDLVVHSASKYLGGHSDVISGVCIGKGDTIKRMWQQDRELLGGVIAPHDAWLIRRAIRTLHLRMKQHSESVTKIANFLDKHPKVKAVNHPLLESHPQHKLFKEQFSGAGSLFSVELNGTYEETCKFANALNYVKFGISWGGFESLLYMPFAKYDTHEHKNLMRIFIGLEDTDELLKDFDYALSKI